WPYTAALEATCSVLEALDALRADAPGLYDQHHGRYVTLLRSLFDNLGYYRGSYRLFSYAHRGAWSIYGVHRAGRKGGATVTGIENVYDDQMWICRELTRAYRLTADDDYLREAAMLADYCIDGWDCCLDPNGNEYGGISWGPGYNSKHSCSNGPLIQPLVWLHDIFATPDEAADYAYNYIDADGNRLTTQRLRSEVYLEFARKVYAWQKTKLLNRSTGVYYDMLGADNTIQYVTAPDGLRYRTHVDTGNPGGTAYTYNTGTMLAGTAELYRLTGDDAYLTDLSKLLSSSYSQFGRAKRIDGVTYRLWPTDAKATSGFNCWFNDVLMRAAVDAWPYAPANAARILNSYQQNLDYAWEHFRTADESFLPINLLEGWGDSPVTKGFHQLAFAAEYAILAAWQHSVLLAESISAPVADPFPDGAAPAYTIAGQRATPATQGIIATQGRKYLIR
ncbi:MAG: alpha-1,6-mannanase, partial [Bacteroidales bacterium]|nr:alpha-1,6-mannanase [Bacteroidales bacterium]